MYKNIATIFRLKFLFYGFLFISNSCKAQFSDYPNKVKPINRKNKIPAQNNYDKICFKELDSTRLFHFNNADTIFEKFTYNNVVYDATFILVNKFGTAKIFLANQLNDKTKTISFFYKGSEKRHILSPIAVFDTDGNYKKESQKIFYPILKILR